MSAAEAKSGEAYVEISARKGLLEKGLLAAQDAMKRTAAIATVLNARISQSYNAVSASVNAFGTRAFAVSRMIPTAAQASLRGLSTTAKGITSTLGRGFMSVGSALSSLTASAMSLKGALAAAMAASGVGMMVKGFANAAGNIDDMAKRTGLAAEEIQGLTFAAKMSGTSIEAVEGAIRKMQKQMAAGNTDTFTGLAAGLAAIPNPAQRAAAAAKALGVSIDAVPKTILDPNAGQNIDAVRTALGEMTRAAGKTPMATFRAMADRIAAISDPSQRAAEAMRIFGKSGTALLPMFENGSAGIDELTREAERLGLVMSGDAVTAGAQLGDMLDKVWMTLGALSNRIGSKLAPLIQTLADRFLSVAETVTTFIENNGAAIVSMAQMGAMVGVGAVALVGLATSIGAVGVVLSGIGAAIGALGGMVALLLSPIGLLLSSLVALGAAVTYFSVDSSTALAWIQTQWQSLTEYVMPIINGIATAMMSGQWAAAGTIGMLALEQALRIGVQPIYNIWTDLYTWIGTAAIDAVTTVANVFAGIPTTLMNVFSTTITWLTGAFDQAVTGIQNAFSTVFTWLGGTWDKTVNGIAKALLWLYSLFDRSIDYEAKARQMDADAKKRSEERQKSLDATTADRRKNADERANQRQKELDIVVTQRNESLQRANLERLQFAEGVKSNMRQDADTRKSEFDARIQQLGDEIATAIADVQQNAPATPETPERLERPERPAAPELPSPGLVAEDTAIKTQGTFSGFAAGMLGTGQSAIDRLEKETKRQTDILQAIAENTAEDDALELS